MPSLLSKQVAMHTFQRLNRTKMAIQYFEGASGALGAATTTMLWLGSLETQHCLEFMAASDLAR